MIALTPLLRLWCGAQITFVWLRRPHQEALADEYRDLIDMPILAVGAAFDYHAGLVSEPPKWMQDKGLQWLYRLVQDPRRLWRRYLLLNPAYVTLVFLQWIGIHFTQPIASARSISEVRYGYAVCSS